MDAPLRTVVAAYRSPYFRQWVLVTALGALLAPFIAANGVGLAFLLSPQLESSTFGFVAIAFPLLGLVVSICQWFFLRKHFRKAYGWIVATVLGHLLGGLLLESFNGLLSVGLARRLLELLCVGLVLGLAQYLFFKRQRVAIAWGWIVAVILVRFIQAALPIDLPFLFDIATDCLEAIINGCITGILIVSFIEQTKAA